MCSLYLSAKEPRRSGGIGDREGEFRERRRAVGDYLKAGINARTQPIAWVGEA